MTGYAKIYHRILSDPKTLSLSIAEFGAFVWCITWCSREETDGRFTYASVSSGCKFRGLSRSLHRLVTVGLVSSNGTDYVISGYLKYQTPKKAIQEKRAKDRERKAARLSANSRRKDSGPSTENREQRTENRDLKSNTPKPSKPKSVRQTPTWRFVPENWSPGSAHFEKAKKLRVDIATEEDKFRNWEFKTPKRDADRAFHTWLSNAQQMNSGRTGGTTRPQQTGNTGPLAELLEDINIQETNLITVEG